MSEEVKDVTVVDRESFPIGGESQNLMQWMKILADAPYYKKMGGLPAMTSIVLTGRELGVAPMMSLNGGFFDVQGKITMSAEMMRSLLRKRGHSLTKVSHDDRHCRLKGKRKDNGDEWDEMFTIEDATRAGLTNRDNWKKHPKDMLLASCTRKLCRALFPDIFGGTATDVSEAEIIEVQPEEEKPIDAQTAKFIDTFGLLDLNCSASKFIDSIAANIGKTRYDTIVDCAKDEDKFKKNLDRFIEKIQKSQKKEDPVKSKVVEDKE